MVYGVLALLSAQIVLVVLTATAYLRIRSHSDAEKNERISWGIKVEAAVNTADAAKRSVEVIELSHYKALLAKFEAQGLEIAELKKENSSLRAEVIGIRTKLASMGKEERRREREGVFEDAFPQPEKNGVVPTPQANRPTFGKIP